MGGRKLIDLTGKIFGKLTVVSRVPGPSRLPTWYCECTCGTATVALSGNLSQGITQSCGCLRIQNGREKLLNLEGVVFGKLRALCVVPKMKNKANREWACECACGNVKIIRGDRLVRGEIISCGCAANKGPLLAFRPLQVRAESAVRGHIRRSRTIVGGGSFSAVEVESVLAKQKCKCANCFTILVRGKFHRDHKIALSRGGSNLISNIQLLCVPCNRKKYNKDPIEFARQQGRLL